MITKKREPDRISKLLRFIAQQLSSRPAARGVDYYMKITKDGVIYFHPNIICFRDTAHKKQSDGVPAVQLVCEQKFDLEPTLLEDGGVQVPAGFFPAGDYHYAKPYKNSRLREWIITPF